MTELSQRALITLYFLMAFLDTIEQIGRQSEKKMVEFCSSIMELFNMKRSVPTLFEVRTQTMNLVTQLRSALNFRVSGGVEEIFERLPNLLFGHVTDVPNLCCQLAEQYFGEKGTLSRWALCYDELEIAPTWLKDELLASVQSVNQKIVYKLTWSPFFPTEIPANLESESKVDAIRLWQSLTHEQWLFCRELSTNFLRKRLNNPSITPKDFLSSSVTEFEHNQQLSSLEYDSIKQLAIYDPSFSEILRLHGIDPNDPRPKSNQEDSFLHSVTPIVLLRTELENSTGIRSKEASNMFSGEGAVYHMSESNPRWLLGILGALCDKWSSRTRSVSKRKPKISRTAQAQVLTNAAKSYSFYLSTIPCNMSNQTDDEICSLWDWIFRLGDAIRFEILKSKPFPSNPPGCFYLEKNASQFMINAVEYATKVGALINVESSDLPLSSSVFEQNYRLHYVFSPIFKIPFRTYRSVPLNNLLTKTS